MNEDRQTYSGSKRSHPTKTRLSSFLRRISQPFSHSQRTASLPEDSSSLHHSSSLYHHHHQDTASPLACQHVGQYSPPTMSQESPVHGSRRSSSKPYSESIDDAATRRYSSKAFNESVDDAASRRSGSKQFNESVDDAASHNDHKELAKQLSVSPKKLSRVCSPVGSSPNVSDNSCSSSPSHVKHSEISSSPGHVKHSSVSSPPVIVKHSSVSSGNVRLSDVDNRCSSSTGLRYSDVGQIEKVAENITSISAAQKRQIFKKNSMSGSNKNKQISQNDNDHGVLYDPLKSKLTNKSIFIGQSLDSETIDGCSSEKVSSKNVLKLDNSNLFTPFLHVHSNERNSDYKHHVMRKNSSLCDDTFEKRSNSKENDSLGLCASKIYSTSTEKCSERVKLVASGKQQSFSRQSKIVSCNNSFEIGGLIEKNVTILLNEQNYPDSNNRKIDGPCSKSKSTGSIYCRTKSLTASNTYETYQNVDFSEELKPLSRSPSTSDYNSRLNAMKSSDQSAVGGSWVDTQAYSMMAKSLPCSPCFRNSWYSDSVEKEEFLLDIARLPRTSKRKSFKSYLRGIFFRKKELSLNDEYGKGCCILDLHFKIVIQLTNIFNSTKHRACATSLINFGTEIYVSQLL